jgi:hypothetical protein
MSPGVLLSSGYIAGGAIGGVLIAFFEFAPAFNKAINLERYLPKEFIDSDAQALCAFGVLLVLMLCVGLDWLLKSGPQVAHSHSADSES